MFCLPSWIAFDWKAWVVFFCLAGFGLLLIIGTLSRTELMDEWLATMPLAENIQFRLDVLLQAARLDGTDSAKLYGALTNLQKWKLVQDFETTAGQTAGGRLLPSVPPAAGAVVSCPQRLACA